jgi:hypothetical protein
VPTNISDTEVNDATAFKFDFESLEKRGSGTATLGTCKSFSLDMSGYSGLKIGAFFDVKPADELTPKFGTYIPWPPNIFADDKNADIPILTTEENSAPIFAREHVYELSMCACLFARCMSRDNRKALQPLYSLTFCNSSPIFGRFLAVCESFAFFFGIRERYAN